MVLYIGYQAHKHIESQYRSISTRKPFSLIKIKKIKKQYWFVTLALFLITKCFVFLKHSWTLLSKHIVVVQSFSRSLPPTNLLFHISVMTGLALVLYYLRKVFPVWLMIQDSGAIRQAETFFIRKNVICRIYTLLNKQDINKKASHLLNALKCHMSLIWTMTAGLSIHLTLPGAPWHFEREELCVGVLWCTVWQASCHCQH